MSDPRTQTWVIAASGTTSGAVSKYDEDLVGFEMPSAFTGASVTFQVSNDDTTYRALTWEGAVVTIVVAASQAVSLDPSKFAGYQHVKIVSGSSEAAQRTITPVWRRYVT